MYLKQYKESQRKVDKNPRDFKKLERTFKAMLQTTILLLLGIAGTKRKNFIMRK